MGIDRNKITTHKFNMEPLYADMGYPPEDEWNFLSENDDLLFLQNESQSESSIWLPENVPVDIP